MENKNVVFEEFIRNLNKMKDQYENAKVKCGVIGVSGSGKSSLINTIAGEKIVQVGSTEQTNEPQEYYHGRLCFVDLPGCSTKKWPRDRYISSLKLDEYDCFIIVTANRFLEDDAFLYNELNIKLKKPCFLIRNKFDLAISDEKFDNNLSEAETRKKIIQNIQDNLSPLQPNRIYLTSARLPELYDLPDLLIDISESLDGMKKERFIADVMAWNEKAFFEKRGIAKKLVTIYSGLSAANGLNPIIGLDISIDISLLMKLSKEVTYIYGLSEKQFEYVKSFIPDGPDLKVLKQEIKQYFSKFLLKESIVRILEMLGKNEALKVSSEFIPVIGQALSAVLGYKLTFSFGKDLIDESENLAKQLLEHIIAKS